MRCLVLVQLFGKKLKGSNFWKAVVDERGGSAAGVGRYSGRIFFLFCSQYSF
jgi:hypothetical protein